MSTEDPRIMTIRHGRPLASGPAWIPGRELAEWWRKYDSARADPKHPPPPELVARTRSAAVLTSSPLRRAFTSAKLLDDTREPLLIPEGYEVGSALPRSRIPMPRIVWSALARALWALGHRGSEESLKEARTRARFVAQHLERLADERGSVAFVGHGVLNHLVGSALRESGWVGVAHNPRRYWGSTTYRRPSDLDPSPMRVSPDGAG